MLSDDSILRRVPAQVDPKQALFIDGIRHAVEIMDLAYNRLRETLTKIALDPPSPTTLPKIVPFIFLDAWAMIDAIDRFRMLYDQMPRIKFGPPIAGIDPLKTVIQPFRELRNIADHLSQRADLVISKCGAALGTLTWLTAFKLDPMTLWLCTLRPGTIRTMPEFLNEPIVSKLNWPTDRICLSAGGVEVSLSDIRPHIERRVRHFEDQLKSEFDRLGITEAPAASDVFLRQPFQRAPDQD
jgi:hypothetical protein